MRRTKIVCTIGPASSSTEELDRLVAAGLDVARLNFSHGTHDEHADVIRRIRDGEARWGRPVAILQDLQGPKIRLGTFGPGGGARVDLEPGRPFTLYAHPVEGTAERASITHPEYLRDLRAGDEIWMDDGMIQLRVETTSPGEVCCRVVVGGRISDHKGLSLPRVKLPVSCLTDKDREDLRFGLRHGVDYVAISFVRSADDIDEVREFLRAEAVDLPIVVQDYPPISGFSMEAGLLARIAREVPAARTVKLEEPPTPFKTARILAAAGETRVAILGGLGGVFLLEELMAGAAGVMTGFAFPEVLVQVVTLYRAGKIDEAANIFYKFVPLMRFEFQEGIGMAIRKEVFKRRGAIADASTRQPGAVLDEGTRAALDRVLAWTAQQEGAAWILG